MAPYISWRINGVGLPPIARVSSPRPSVSTRRSPIDIPGRHGVVDQGLPQFAETLITLTIEATAGSQAAVEAAIAKLHALLSGPSIVITRVAGDFSASGPARLVSISPGRHTPSVWQEMTAVLAIPAGMLSGPPSAGTPLAFSANLTGALLPHLQGSSAPITDAIVRLKGPHAGLFTITDAATGTGLSQSTASLTGSQYLYMDAGGFRSWISASDSAWTGVGTDVSANLDYPAAGILQLWPVVEPAVGDSSFAAASTPTVRISATGGTGRTGDTTLAVYAGRSFL
ncbi:MAG TPA: hypothetical protein PKD84_13405 [Propionicimonas sp.]|nr:hypothetical protein [Propionicimonas sp.]